jgi:hypothetical protein
MSGRGLAALLGRRVAGDDEEIVVRMLVARAQSRLDAQLHGRQWLDLKALGLLGADAAAAGVLIAVHDAVNRFWWVDATGLAFGSGAAVDVARQMLAELLEAIETNDRVTRAHQPELLIELSLVLIVLPLAGAVPVSLLG